MEGWTRVTKQSAIELAIQVAEHGVNAIIYTDIERDGMLSGPNVASIRALTRAVHIPIIASGGVSRLQDIKDLLLLEPEGVVGVVIGKALYTGNIDLKEAMAITQSE